MQPAAFGLPDSARLQGPEIDGSISKITDPVYNVLNGNEQMANHVKLLGILHIIFSALGILIAIGLLLFFGGMAGVVGATDRTDDRFVAMPILTGIGLLVFVAVLVLSLPGFIAGIGLLKFRPWARILGIVISALDLISIPFGTALGIYGLWVLLSNQAEVLFRTPQPGPPAPAWTPPR